MCKYWLSLLLVAASSSAMAREWQPSRDFLKAVCFVESSNGRMVVGDNGESLGDFQISEAAWLDVNAWRKARKLKTYAYNPHVFNSFINRVYAANYLTILHGELTRQLKRAPRHAELYAAYNIGFAEFAQCGFELGRVNPVTREKCRQIDSMLASR